MLPRVKILFENGLLGGFNSSADGLVGLVCTGVAVGETFALATPYSLRKLEDLEALGVTETSVGNERLYKNVKEFYKEASVGTQLWIIAFANTVSLSDMVDKDENYAKLLLSKERTIKGIICDFAPAAGYTPVVENGMDADVALALTKASLLAAYQTDRHAPTFFVLPVQYFSGTVANLTSLKAMTHNHVALVLGDSASGTNSACMGLIGGKIAANPVHRHIGRVRSGAISATKIYIKTTEAKLVDTESIDDKGYITFRTFEENGKAGYYISDDDTAAADSDDYSSLTRLRTIHKAYRIADATLVEELNDEIPVTNAGTLTPAFAKSLEKTLEDAISNQMGENLGRDPEDTNDKGVKAYVNYNQNVITSSQFEVVLRVKPYGYSKFIDVKLGFLTTNG
jgi:hypothetical protein